MSHFKALTTSKCFILPSKGAEEIHIITADKTVQSSERNGLCISFDLLFFGVGVFVEKRPKRILMWNRTHEENNQEMFTTASEENSSPRTPSFQLAFESFSKYHVCLRRLPESLMGRVIYSGHTLYLNEAIKLTRVVVRDHSNNLQHYHINKCHFCYS